MWLKVCGAQQPLLLPSKPIGDYILCLFLSLFIFIYGIGSSLNWAPFMLRGIDLFDSCCNFFQSGIPVHRISISLNISITSRSVVMVRVVFYEFTTLYMCCVQSVYGENFTLMCSFGTDLIEDSLYNSPLEKIIYESKRKNYPK